VHQQQLVNKEKRLKKAPGETALLTTVFSVPGKYAWSGRRRNIKKIGETAMQR
jgi:hypothetical protein